MNKKGKWVNARFDIDKGKYIIDESKKYGAEICSNCKEEAYADSDWGYKRFPYCPWCGAEMENSDYGL